MARLTRGFWLTSVCLALACGDKGSDKKADESKDVASAEEGGEAPTAEPATKVSTPERLLAYLEPEAIGVLYVRPPEGGPLDPELLSTVFALPPRGQALVAAALSVDEMLATVLGPDAPPVSEILGEEILAMTPAVANGTYVVRPLKKTPAEVEALLTADAMRKTEVEGTSILTPTGAFPYKAAMLDDDVIAFIPVGEIGSGLNPLTAGRDLPASEVRLELTELLKNDPSVHFVGIVAGPMLHLELTDDVGLARLILRRWQEGGLDAEIRLQTTGKPDVAAKELEERTAPLETDQVQALVDRVAFTVDGPTVAGRLQLTKDDLAHLRKSP
jgi:hypothetical protein